MIAKYLANLPQLRNRGGLAHAMKASFKYYPAWKRSLAPSTTALSDGVPWITFEAQAFLDSILTPTGIIFEYGSGGSTLYYSKRVQKVVSVENDANWANLVKRALIQRELQNCECRHVPSKKSLRAIGSPDDPQSYFSSAEEYKNHSFREYVVSIDAFPDQFFDFVAVDGRARPACMYYARQKVKIGGYLMLDNSDRPHYQRSKELLASWEKYEFFGPGPYNDYFWETTIWRRLSD